MSEVPLYRQKPRLRQTAREAERTPSNFFCDFSSCRVSTCIQGLHVGGFSPISCMINGRKICVLEATRTKKILSTAQVAKQRVGSTQLWRGDLS